MIKFNLKRPRQQEVNQALVWDHKTGIVLEQRDKKTLVHFPGIVSEEPFFVEGTIQDVYETINAQFGKKSADK